MMETEISYRSSSLSLYIERRVCTMSSLSKVMDSYRGLLRDFGIQMTPEIQHRIIEKYPNDIAIENYILCLILKHLNDNYG